MKTREDGHGRGLQVGVEVDDGRVYAEAIVEAGPFCEWDLCLAPFAGPPRRGCGSPYLHANGTWVGPAPTDEPAPNADAKIDRVSTLRGSILPVPIDDVSLFTSVAPDAFAALPRLSHDEIQAALDKGRAEAFPDRHPLAADVARCPNRRDGGAHSLGTINGDTSGRTYCIACGEAVIARPSTDRAAWLLHPVSSTGRETIAASQYEELRAEAVALCVRVAELEARAHLWRDNEARAVDGWARVAELEAEVAKERAAFTGANTAWSRAVVLQEQAQDERDAMRARAEEAERKLSAVAELQRSTAADLDAARAQLRLVSAGPADVWRWQGDGHDDPASLACPVVMSASTLREFVAARVRVTELESERSAALVLLEAEPELGLCKGVTLAIQLARHEAVAASSRWFAIPEHQRLDRIGQIVDQLADVRHELDDDDIEAAEALIDLAKGAPSPVARAVAEALSIAQVDVREGPFGTTVDALNAITDLAMKSGNADGSTDPERSWLRRIVKVGLLALASDAEPAIEEPSR